MWKVYVLIILALLMFVLAVDSILKGHYWQFAGEVLAGLVDAFVAVGMKSDIKNKTI